MHPVSGDGTSTSKLASGSHKFAGAISIGIHAEQGFCVMAGTVQCAIEGETGTIAATLDFAPGLALQILLDGLAI